MTRSSAPFTMRALTSVFLLVTQLDLSSATTPKLPANMGHAYFDNSEKTVSLTKPLLFIPEPSPASYSYDYTEVYEIIEEYSASVSYTEVYEYTELYMLREDMSGEYESGEYVEPTSQPTDQPTAQPTAQPTGQPTGEPTGQPTAQPTGEPTAQPTGQPTAQPTAQPTGEPTAQPTGQPTAQPTGQPTGEPTGQPTAQPTAQPTGEPTAQPTGEPTAQPTGQPTGKPTSKPTGQPTGEPTAQPTGQPTGKPTSKPTSAPTSSPSASPTAHPSVSPSASPSARPTSLPTLSPTSKPTVDGATNRPTTTPSVSPPELVSATFSNGGRYITVKMSAATDRASTVLSSVTSSFTCSLVLTFPGASEDQCRWTDTETILVTVSSTSVFAQVGDELYLQASRTKALCSPTRCAELMYSPSSFVLIGYPANPVSPSVLVESPSPINRCGKIVLDTTGSSGRGSAPWQELVWNVTSLTADTSAIEAYLDSVTVSTTGSFTVSNSLLSAGTYLFQLCATNMFSLTSCTSKEITVSINTNIPTVSLSGVSNMFRYQSLSISGIASVPGCDGSASSSTGLTYAFKLYKDSVLQTGIASISNNPSSYMLAPSTLEVNTVYDLELTVTTRSSVTNSATHRFTVGRAGVAARISQGSLTEVYESGSRSLDADPSSDLDYPSDKTNLIYNWNCVTRTPTPGLPCPVTYPATSQITVDGNDYVATQTYLFTVTVANGLVLASESTASVVLTVSPGLPIPTLDFVGLQEKYNNDVRFVLRVSVNTQFASSEIEWSADDSNGDSIALQSIALTPLSQTLSAGVTPLGLTVARNTLTEGGTYTFRMKATYFPSQSSDIAETASETIIVINQAPWGGSFSVSPSDGIAANTEFTLSSPGWEDDPADYPLSYRYAFYQNDPETAYLLRDYGTAASMLAFLGSGRAVDNYDIVCISWIADVYEFSTYSEFGPIRVIPISEDQWGNAGQLTRAAQGQPHLRRQLSLALISSINAVDCSVAPDCGASNRMECSATAGTCGSCKADFPIGTYGDANTECICDGCSERDIGANVVSGVDGSSTSVAVSTSAKICPHDCSLQGDCIFVNWFGEVVDSCDAVDSSCRASCVCEEGWFGSDCTRNLTTIELSIKTRELLCNASYESLVFEDLTDYIVKSYALEVSALLVDLTQVSDSAYMDCSSLVIGMIALAPDAAVTDVALPYVLESLSSILEKGVSIPDDIYDGVIDSIKLLNEHRQLSMSPGEKPVEVYTRNLRYFTSTNFLGDLQLSTSWSVAQSPLEKSVGVDVSNMVVTNDLAVNNSIANTVTVVGISIWQIIINTGRTTGLNGSLVEMQSRVISGDLEQDPADRVTIVIYNREPVYYYTDEIVTGTLYCHSSSSNTPYGVGVSCGDSNEVVTCPGNLPLYVDYTCPYSADSPKCLFYDGSDYVENPLCEAIAHDAYSTTCSCERSVLEVSRRLVVDSARSYDFISSKKVTSTNLALVWNAFTPHAGFGDNVIIFIMVLAFTFLTMVGVICILRNGEKRSIDPVKVHYRRVMNVAAHILSLEYGHSNVYSRYFRALWRKSEYLSIFRWRSVLSPAESVDLFEKWMVLAGYFLNFMFVHAIFAWSIYDDDGECEKILREDRCDDRQSLLLLNSRCEWRSDGDAYCRLRSPLQSEIEIFILVAFCAMFVVPLNYFWRIAVNNLTHLYMGKHVDIVSLVSDVADYAALSAKGSSAKLRDAETTKTYYNSAKATLQISGVTEGLVEEESDYVFTAAKTLVVESESEAQAMTNNGMHRIYLKKKLKLDRNGDVKDRAALIPRTAVRVAKKLRRARNDARDMVDTMSIFQDDELKNSYVIVQFLLHCLPESLRNFAVRYFLMSNDFYSAANIDSAFYHYSIYLLPVYIIGVLIVLVVLGFQWYSQLTTRAWACLVAISFAFDCVIHIPFRVYFRSIVIPAFFLTELRRIHRCIRSRYGAIVSNMRDEKITPGLELVQHFNPSCRAARLAPITTKITESFMFITDNDLPVLDEEEDGEGFWALMTKALTVMAYAVTVVLYWLTPEVLVDIVLDWMVICVCLLLLLAFYTMSTVALFVPFVVILGIATILVIREIVFNGIKKYHGPHGAHVHVDDGSKKHVVQSDRRFSTNNFDHSLAAIFGRALEVDEDKVSIASHSEMTSVRKALLDAADMDMVKKVDTVKQVDTVKPVDTVKQVDAVKEVERDLDEHVPVSIKEKPEENLLTRIQVSPEPVKLEPITSIKKRGKEYVHLSSHDYRVLSEAIIKYLGEEEEQIVGRGDSFRGVIVPQTVDRILRENENLGTSFGSEDTKRASKVIGKVIKHMIDKDGTVVIIPQDGDKTRVTNAQANAMNSPGFQSMMIQTGESFAPGDPAADYDGVPFDECYIALPRVAPDSPVKVPSPVQRMDTFKARVQVNSSDYKVVTAGVLAYLKKEEELWGGQNGGPEGFPGIMTVDVVDWVCRESVGDLQNNPQFASDVKKQKKIVHKIISRMANSDKTIDSVGDIAPIPAKDGGKLKYPPHEDSFIRLHRDLKLEAAEPAPAQELVAVESAPAQEIAL